MNNSAPLQKQFQPAWLISLILGLITFFLYFPVRTQEFQRMDDPDYVYLNPHVKTGLNSENIAWAFTHSHSSNWHPLTWLSHMLDCQWFGVNPGPQHLINAAIHSINSGLLLLLLFRFFSSRGRQSALISNLGAPADRTAESTAATIAPASGWDGNSALACSTLVAALFALHPLHVESVAWIAERKDVLSAFFWILTMWAYCIYGAAKATSPGKDAVSTIGKDAVPASLISPPHGKDAVPASLISPPHGKDAVPASLISPPPGKDGVSPSLTKSLGWYSLTLLLFTMGLMSKPMVVTLPFVLLLLDFWPLKRLCMSSLGPTIRSAWPLVLEKIPFFLLSAACSVITLLIQGHSGAVVSLNDLPLLFRIENVVISYIRYLYLMVVPINLAVFYPLPKVIPLWKPVCSLIILIGISTVSLRQAKTRPYLLFGWLWYLGTLIPVIGLVKAGEQAIADRYTYIPLIGIFISIAWALRDLACQPRIRRSLVALAGAAVIACAWLTSIQLSYWKNSRTLYEHAAKATTHNYAAMMILGGMLWEEGKLTEAKVLILEGLRDAPHSPDLHNSMGFVLIGEHKFDDALPHFEEALRFAPDMAAAWYGKGYCELQQKRFAVSETSSARAWQLNPAEYKAGLMLALAQQNQNKPADAEASYRKLLDSKPGWAPALRGLADLKAGIGKLDEAINYYSQALKTEPNDLESLNGLASSLANSGSISAAIDNYSASLKIDPSQPITQARYAELLSSQGRYKEAIEHYHKCLALDENFIEAANNLAWLLATCSDATIRDGKQAVLLAESVSNKTEAKIPFYLGTLAAAYAEAGRFTDAVAAAEKARDLAQKQGLSDVANRNAELLKFYQSQKPFHESPRG